MHGNKYFYYQHETWEPGRTETGLCVKNDDDEVFFPCHESHGASTHPETRGVGLNEARRRRHFEQGDGGIIFKEDKGTLALKKTRGQQLSMRQGGSREVERQKGALTVFDFSARLRPH